MELQEALRRRRMVRAYEPRPVDPAALNRVLWAGLRGPSAGNSQGLDLIVLNGPAETGSYWTITLPDQADRADFTWSGLVAAPVLVVPVVTAAAYTARYSEADKSYAQHLADEAAWTVPFWWVDGGMGVMAMLLTAVDEGLGALYFGIFSHEAELLAELGVPSSSRALGTIALGHPARGQDRPGLSASRPRRGLADAVHRGGTWNEVAADTV